MSFSRDPKQVLADAASKGYSRVRFQQGKPLLDRELNLLGDLANPQRIAEPYIGSGVPAGSDGFAISNLGANDFTIGAGRCMVNGNEVVLGANTTYKTQPNKGRLTAFPATPFGVYLRIFPTEFTEVEDADLKNAGDVGFVTALREKTDWEVVTSVAVPPAADHYQLATIDPVAKTIADNRRRELTVASLRDEVSAARGTAAKLSDRLGASLGPAGGIKANTITNAQLANDSITTNKLIDGSVTGQKVAASSINEVNLGGSVVSRRTIQDGAVSMLKLGLTVVANDVQVVVPAAAANVPGEVTVPLQTVDDHAFYLISVRQISPRPQLQNPIGFAVNWMHRILTVKAPGLGAPYSHVHQVVVQNPTGTPITVVCKAFRIADT